MAQIWMDEQNVGAHMLPRSARKAVRDTALPQSAFKTVLGNLENNLALKQFTTPFKGANRNTNRKWPISAPELSLRKEKLQKQHLMQYQRDAPHLIEGESLPSAGHCLAASTFKDNIDLFDYMDFPTKKCLNNCHKPISGNWLKPLNDDWANKFLNNSVDMDEEVINDMPNYPDFDIEPLKDIEPLELIDIDSESDHNVSETLDAVPPLPISLD